MASLTCNRTTGAAHPANAGTNKMKIEFTWYGGCDFDPKTFWTKTEALKAAQPWQRPISIGFRFCRTWCLISAGNSIAQKDGSEFPVTTAHIGGNAYIGPSNPEILKTHMDSLVQSSRDFALAVLSRAKEAA